jgi:D-3-phosphoglycerate dehydrogenase / 2-oxoglutarate reductase
VTGRDSCRLFFVDANDALAAVTDKQLRAGDPPVTIHRDPDVKPDELPAVLGDA